MNRYIQILAKANAILFSFVIPFTVVYIYLDRMYTSNAEVQIAYAAEQTEKGQADYEMIKASSTAAKAKLAQQKKTAQLLSSRIKTASLVSSVPQKVSLAEASVILPLIAECESGGDPTARSAISSAKGYLQIIDGTWKAFSCTGSPLNKQDNIACGIKIATQSGLQHWNESRSCWAKKVTSKAGAASASTSIQLSER